MRVQSSVSKTVADTVRRGRSRFFEASDFEGSRTAVERALSRLENQGELLRVRKGTYWRGMQTRFGMARPSTSQVVSHILKGMNYGLSSFSAANALGLSSQVSAIMTVAVSGGAPRDLDRPAVRFVARSGRRGQGRLRLRPEEIALLEVAAEWDDLVDIGTEEARRQLAGLVNGSTLRPAALMRASRTETASVRERLAQLGFVDEQRLVSA